MRPSFRSGSRHAPTTATRHFIALRQLCRLFTPLLPWALAAAPGLAHAANPLQDPPGAAYVQLGHAEHAESLTLGATWEWAWQKSTGWGQWSGYWEAAVAAWHNSRADGQDDSELFAQMGITPVVRLEPGGMNGLFLEGGVGVNLIVPRYRSRHRVFSTLFNFGDHLAVGWRFGEGRQQELALRIQHFSNGGIKEPNPGEDFLQLRYVRHF